MRMTLGELRSFINEAIKGDCWGGSHPSETYDQELDEDDALKKHSVIVPDDVKKSISSWMNKMGLAGTHKRAR